jgi:hypothetical protein
MSHQGRLWWTASLFRPPNFTRFSSPKTAISYCDVFVLRDLYCIWMDEVLPKTHMCGIMSALFPKAVINTFMNRNQDEHFDIV